MFLIPLYSAKLIAARRVIFFNIALNLERHLNTCSERVKHLYWNNGYQLREKLFDKLDSFDTSFTDNQKLFNNLASFDFESISVENEDFEDTETAPKIGKHIPVSVSLLSNLMQKLIFLCDLNPRDLVSSFINPLAT